MKAQPCDGIQVWIDDECVGGDLVGVHAVGEYPAEDHVWLPHPAPVVQIHYRVVRFGEPRGRDLHGVWDALGLQSRDDVVCAQRAVLDEDSRHLCEVVICHGWHPTRVGSGVQAALAAGFPTILPP
ncbi:hypothetical protein [Mycolicibacterium poriferae]|uniref:hypothetical protein n=1 Tax=Mycolicibacterium poriferae TaxID=39694 RepID=UPI00321933D3